MGATFAILSVGAEQHAKSGLLYFSPWHLPAFDELIINSMDWTGDGRGWELKTGTHYVNIFIIYPRPHRSTGTEIHLDPLFWKDDKISDAMIRGIFVQRIFRKCPQWTKKPPQGNVLKQRAAPLEAQKHGLGRRHQRSGGVWLKTPTLAMHLNTRI